METCLDAVAGALAEYGATLDIGYMPRRFKLSGESKLVVAGAERGLWVFPVPSRRGVGFTLEVMSCESSPLSHRALAELGARCGRDGILVSAHFERGKLLARCFLSVPGRPAPSRFIPALARVVALAEALVHVVGGRRHLDHEVAISCALIRADAADRVRWAKARRARRRAPTTVSRPEVMSLPRWCVLPEPGRRRSTDA